MYRFDKTVLPFVATRRLYLYRRLINFRSIHLDTRILKHGADLIRWLVAQVYNIRDDDGLLRAAMPRGFDQLRKQYRQRRELGLLQIDNFEQLSAQAGELCLALGCRQAPGE